MYKKLFQCLCLLLIFIIITILIKNYFQPFLSILLLTLLTTPIFNLLNKYNIFNRKINALISIVFVNVLFFLFIMYSSNFILLKLNELISYTYNSQGLEHINRNINILSNMNYNDIIKGLQMYYKDLLNSDMLRKGAAYTTDSIFSYFVGNISTYFILVDKYAILKSAEVLVNRESLEQIGRKFFEIKKMIKIEVILIIATTCQTIIGFLILEIDSAIFLGVLCGILDIMPYVGTVLIFLPLIIYEIYLKHYIIAVGLALLYAFLQFNRQFMETKFMSSTLNIHPLMILLSLYIGGKVFGLIGLIMAPMYVLIAKEILITELGDIK